MRILVILLAGLLGGPSLAQGAMSPTEPLRCLAALEGLDVHYRGLMQPTCVEVPIKACAAPAEQESQAVACLTRTILAFEDFYAESRPLLPSEIGGTGTQAVMYRRMMGRIDSTFGAEKSCRGLNAWDETVCHYSDLAISVVEIFMAGRRAGVTIVVPEADPKP